ncbi:hypothetical protein F2Q68_00038657 [Brassica cretica]|uniref:Uncharacterized protein n=1 Tax=Brassica cretica TaxID=69181 RepID=A0A8S9MLU7_BRACR|nr:hypothetical protein F2Q68_00038657 [Brassica cretica]
MGELWASDGVLEMVGPGALVTFSFALLLVLRIPVRIMSTLKRRMDSPVSRSDSSSEPCEGSDCDLMAPLPLSCVYAAPHWWVLPRRLVRTSWRNGGVGEIAVYEAFFDSGLRGVIPALIVGLCNLFEISPSQLNPPASRILIAIQNLGDLEYLSLGINEVAWEPGGFSLDPEIFDWNPEAMWNSEEPGGSSLDLEVFDWNSEAIGELGGSCSDGPRCALSCTGILGSFDSILRLAHTHSCFKSHTHVDFVDVPLWPCHFWDGLARIGGLWRPDPARMPL